jgi:triple functional domain protein
MQKPKELQVFLFEQNIIFSDIIGKKTQFTNPSYIYKSHIQVSPPVVCPCGLSDNSVPFQINKMTIQEIEDSGGKKFLVSSTDPQRSGISFICIASSSELHSEWVRTINHQLQKQFDFVNAIKNPIDYIKKMDSTKSNS